MRVKLLLIMLMLSLTACVTTEEKVFKKNISAEKELESRVQVAISYLQNNNPEQAIAQLKRALDINPKSARVHEVLGLALESTGELERAEYHFEKMLRYDGEYTRGRANYAAYLMRRGDFPKAYKELKVVTNDIYYQNRAIAFQQLAICAEKLQKYEEVEPAYQRAVALDNNFTPALIELAIIKFNNKDYPEAHKYFDQYREKVSQSSARALLLGVKLARIFEDKSAEASYALALKNLYPKSAEYLEYIQNIRDNNNG